jgi:hypothetical protein
MKRGFFKLNAVSLAFKAGGVIGILFAIGFVVIAPVALSMVGLGLTGFGCFISLRAESPIAEMAMDLSWKCRGHDHVDDRVRPALLLFGEFRTL